MNLKLLFKLLVSCLFAAYLSYRVDWSVIFHAFSEINLLLYAVSTFLTLGSILCIAWKYHLLIKNTSISHSVSSLIKINLISRYYAIFLPSAVGPESVRWYKVTRNQKGRALFLASTLFERLVFILVLLFFGFFPLFLYSSHSEILALRNRLLPLAVFSIGFTIAAMAYFIFPDVRNFFNSTMKRIAPRQWDNLNINYYLKDFSLHNPGPLLYANIIGISLLGQIFFLSRLFFLFQSAALPLSFMDITWMGSLVLLLQVLPVSFAGIGLREGAYAYLFTVFELPPEKGVLIGILFFSQMLIYSCIGCIFEYLE